MSQSANSKLVSPLLGIEAGTSCVAIIHGSSATVFDGLVGRPVEFVREPLRDPLGIPPEALAFVNGHQVDFSYLMQAGDIVEFIFPWGRKGSGDERDEYFLRSPDPHLKLNEILVRLRRIEDQLVMANKLQAPAKDFYSIEDFAELVDLAPYTVREHCRLGRIKGIKATYGRGGIQEWRIPHDVLVRYRNYGLLPLRKN
jgi:hypothetical protein